MIDPRYQGNRPSQPPVNQPPQVRPLQQQQKLPPTQPIQPPVNQQLSPGQNQISTTDQEKVSIFWFNYFIRTFLTIEFIKGCSYNASIAIDRCSNSNAATRTKTKYSCIKRTNSTTNWWNVASNLNKFLNFFFTSI